jgi:hypothetical protein
MYGGTFPYSGIVADDDRSVFPIILKVLGRGGYDRAWEYIAVLSNTGTFHYGNIGAYPRTIPNYYVIVNGCKWFYYNIFGNFSPRVNIGQWLIHP